MLLVSGMISDRFPNKSHTCYKMRILHHCDQVSFKDPRKEIKILLRYLSTSIFKLVFPFKLTALLGRQRLVFITCTQDVANSSWSQLSTKTQPTLRVSPQNCPYSLGIPCSETLQAQATQKETLTNCETQTEAAPRAMCSREAQYAQGNCTMLMRSVLGADADCWQRGTAKQRSDAECPRSYFGSSFISAGSRRHVKTPAPQHSFWRPVRSLVGAFTVPPPQGSTLVINVSQASRLTAPGQYSLPRSPSWRSRDITGNSNLPEREATNVRLFARPEQTRKQVVTNTAVLNNTTRVFFS